MSARKTVAALVFALALMTGRAAADIHDWFTIPVAASRNETAQVQALLLEGGNDPDAIDSDGGRTALDYAALFGNLAMAQMLLDHGAHIDARDSFGNIALHWAAERGNLDVMRLLIARKTNVDFQNGQGITPIMAAAEHAQPASVQLLSRAAPIRASTTIPAATRWLGAGKPRLLQALNTER